MLEALGVIGTIAVVWVLFGKYVFAPWVERKAEEIEREVEKELRKEFEEAVKELQEKEEAQDEGQRLKEGLKGI